MNDELERILKEVVMAKLRHYLSICLERPNKTTENLNQDSRGLGQDSNSALPKYESNRNVYKESLLLKRSGMLRFKLIYGLFSLP
jgi:hypothetical protein